MSNLTTGKINPNQPPKGHRAIRWGRLGLLLAAAVLLAWLLTIAGLSWFYTRALLHPSCSPHAHEPPGFETVSITTPDGVTLTGWWHAPSNGAAIVLLPGHAGTRDALLPDALLLAQAGYGILTLDSRGCSGVSASLGYLEAGDADAMADFVLNQPAVNAVGVLGFSAGGVAAIRSAAHNPEIRAVVAQGNYRDLAHEITNRVSAPWSLEWQLQHGVRLAMGIQLGLPPGEVNPARDLARIAPRPVFLIHGEQESENNRAEEQYRLAGEPKILWVVPGSAHGGYFQAAPEEYRRRILQFFDSAFGFEETR